ncbi:hypothetical protein IWQ61_005909 [Dispira simplex]|nr:hypothetical protein IWQ61_005909 [Dispira simplex]
MAARVPDKDRYQDLVAIQAYPPTDPDTPLHEECTWSEITTGMPTNIYFSLLQSTTSGPGESTW